MKVELVPVPNGRYGWGESQGQGVGDSLLDPPRS